MKLLLNDIINDLVTGRIDGDEAKARAARVVDACTPAPWIQYGYGASAWPACDVFCSKDAK